MLAPDQTGSIGPVTDASITYNASTNVLAANISGTSASTTGNAETVTVADTTSATCSVALFESATGALAAKTDGGLTYNASTGVLTATSFSGGVSGGSSNIWLPAEAAYLPATNPAVLTEILGSTTYAGWSVLAYNDTTAQMAVWRVPLLGYNNGNITVTAYSKPATVPGSNKLFNTIYIQ